MWALELFLTTAWQEGGRGWRTPGISRGYILHCLLLLCSVILLVVHSFCWSSSLRRNVFLKKTGDFFFPYYILILQNRNYFILIVFYSSTFVEAQKKYASLNFSNYRNIYVTILCFKKQKYLCACVYNIYKHIYLYTYNSCFPVECIFMRFLTRTKTNRHSISMLLITDKFLNNKISFYLG